MFCITKLNLVPGGFRSAVYNFWCPMWVWWSVAGLILLAAMGPVRAESLVSGNGEYEITPLKMRPFTFFQRDQTVVFLVKKLLADSNESEKHLRVCAGEEYVVGVEKKNGYFQEAYGKAPRLLISPKRSTTGTGYGSGVNIPLMQDDRIVVRVPIRLTTKPLVTTKPPPPPKEIKNQPSSGDMQIALGISDEFPFNWTCWDSKRPPVVVVGIPYQTLSDVDATPIVMPLDWKEQRVVSVADASFLARVSIIGALPNDVVKWKSSGGEGAADVTLAKGKGPDDKIVDPVDKATIGYVYEATLKMPTTLTYSASVEVWRGDQLKVTEKVVSSADDASPDAVNTKPTLDVHDCNDKRRCILTWRAPVPYHVNSGLGLNLSAFRKNQEFEKNLPNEIFSLDHRSEWQSHQDFASQTDTMLDSSLPQINRILYQGGDDSFFTTGTVMPRSGDFTLRFEPAGTP